MLTVSLAYPPSTNRLVRMANGIAYTPKAVKNWTKDAGLRLRAAGARMMEGKVAVTVLLHPKATKAGVPFKRRLDLDNAIKAALDACQGIVFTDDKQVVELSAILTEAIPGGGLTVTIRHFCPVCNGNDRDLPCAYPGEGKAGCPREHRLGDGLK